MNILEIQILTNDITGTEAFYHGLLGLQILSKSNGSVSFSAGISTLTFIRSERTNPFYHFAFNIPDNKISEAYDWIKSKTDILPVSATEKIADFTGWNAKAFYFYDNNGNILEFIARFDLKQPSDHPFKGSSILSVSEIGLPVLNAAAYSEQFVRKNGFGYFGKQAPKDDFAVVGDDHGLLIFVNDRRNWFPTDKPAGKHWTKIRLEEKGRITELVIIP